MPAQHALDVSILHPYRCLIVIYSSRFDVVGDSANRIDSIRYACRHGH